MPTRMPLPSPATESTDGRAQRTDRLLIGALYLLALATYPLAMLVIDSGRDLGAAWSIAFDGDRPLQGPGLNSTWKLGPVWFYLLAALLAVTKSIGATAVCVGALAAAKLPLAYVLGRHWHSRAFGLALAAVLALPGWSTFGQLVLLHTSVVESAVLATLLCALLGWQRRSTGWTLAAAASLGLALHAHPTTLVAAPAVAVALLRLPSAARLAAAPLAVLLFALPLLPMLWAEAATGWPQLQATGDYFGAGGYLRRLGRAAAVARGMTVGQIELVRTVLLQQTPGLAMLAASGLAALGFGAGIGVLRAWRSDLRLRVVSALLLVAWVFVLLLRDHTPEWMTYACAPFGAALLVHGAVASWSTSRQRRVALALATFALACSALLLHERIAVVRGGVQRLPDASIDDVAAPLGRFGALRFWLPAYAHEEVASELCVRGIDVALHGDLASALHFGQGVAAALRCGQGASLRLGGAATRTLAGIPVALATQLGITGVPQRWGYLLLDDVDSILPVRGVAAKPHPRYLLDDFLPLLERGIRGEASAGFACAPGDLVAVTNLVPLLNEPFEFTFAPAGALQPLAETVATRYFRCDGYADVQLTLRAPAIESANVFRLRRAAARTPVRSAADAP